VPWQVEPAVPLKIALPSTVPPAPRGTVASAESDVQLECKCDASVSLVGNLQMYAVLRSGLTVRREQGMDWGACWIVHHFGRRMPCPS